MGNFIKFRIIYYGKNGTIYSVIEEYREEDGLALGEWEKPFPNTENDSTACGLLECLAQSEYCPLIFRTEEVAKVKVVLVSENCVTI